MRLFPLIVLAASLAPIPAATATAQSHADIDRWVVEFQQESATDQATGKLAAAAKKDLYARQILVEHLPPLIERLRGPVWINAIRLAGDLRISEAVPALVELLKHLNTKGGPFTFGQEFRLDDDPAGRALVAIGEPAAKAVGKLLEDSDQNIRWRAALVLSNMDSVAADDQLSRHVGHESNPGIRKYIQARMIEAKGLRADSPGVSAVAAPWRQEMSLGGPIAIVLRVRNLSDTEIAVNLGEDEKEGISIFLRSAEGKTYSSKWSPKEGLALYGIIRMSPGSEIERQLVLQDWGISPAPGTYETRLSFKYEIRSGLNKEITLPPVSLRIHVIARSDAEIRKSCDEASAAFLGAHDSTEASQAAKLLSRFANESALECLARTYYSSSPYHFDNLIIDAIGGIGTEAAKAVLLNIQKSGRGEDSAFATNALEKSRMH